MGSKKLLRVLFCFTVFVSVVLFLSLYTVQAQQLKNNKKDSSAICSDDKFIMAEPGQCYGQCQETDFYLSHKKSCKYVFDNIRNQVKPTADSVELVDLKSCLEKLREIPPEEVPLGDDFEWVRLFLKGKPDCAANVKVLHRMYNCLLTEGEQLEAKLEELKEKGYIDAKNDDEICRYTREQFTNDFRLAKEVQDGIKILIEESKSVSQCNIKFKEWIESKDSKENPNDSEINDTCHGNPVCAQQVKILSGKLKNDLSPVIKKQSEMSMKLSSIESDSQAMQTIFGFYIIYGCNLD